MYFLSWLPNNQIKAQIEIKLTKAMFLIFFNVVIFFNAKILENRAFCLSIGYCWCSSTVLGLQPGQDRLGHLIFNKVERTEHFKAALQNSAFLFITKFVFSKKPFFK